MWFKLANALEDYWGRKGTGDGQKAIAGTSFLSAAVDAPEAFLHTDKPEAKGSSKGDRRKMPSRVDAFLSPRSWSQACSRLPHVGVCTAFCKEETGPAHHWYQPQDASSAPNLCHSPHLDGCNLSL